MIDERDAKLILGKLMTQVFGTSRRSGNLTNMGFYSTQRSRRSKPLQVGSLYLGYEDIILPLEFEAMCSAWYSIVLQDTFRCAWHW